ncbi:MAG: FAD-dependent monooxygenase, partial [Solirubrobacteraceae bacterium]|nr:FAD-dependent monooxygenase [Solirubrobacteraceae bacterium]
MSAQPDVVVVGGGPVGLLVASELALNGVAVTLVERLAETVDQPKAGTLHARAAQSLRRRGYLPPGPLEGPPGAVARSPFHFAAQRTFEITSPLAEGAPVVGRWQGDLERFLEAVCLARGVQVLRGTSVVAIEPGTTGARLELESERDGPSVLTPDWVVGADGARSIVRAAAGIGATDQPATMRALLGRVTLLDPDRAPVGWHETPRGWTLVNRAIDADGTSRL